MIESYLETLDNTDNNLMRRNENDKEEDAEGYISWSDSGDEGSDEGDESEGNFHNRMERRQAVETPQTANQYINFLLDEIEIGKGGESK